MDTKMSTLVTRICSFPSLRFLLLYDACLENLHPLYSRHASAGSADLIGQVTYKQTSRKSEAARSRITILHTLEIV